MRIVGGRLRSRPIAGPKAEGLRPTADRLREALFNILMHAYGDPVTGARVLDLFAGSGALGIESLSRGAAHATFVDNNARALDAITGNLPDHDRATLVRRDATTFLRAAADQYDLVFLDPPYRLDAALAAALPEAVKAVLAPGATVVSESDRRAPLEIDLPIEDERRYGDTLIRIHGPR